MFVLRVKIAEKNMATTIIIMLIAQIHPVHLSFSVTFIHKKTPCRIMPVNSNFLTTLILFAE